MKAVLQVESVIILCPGCHAAINHPSTGSEFWTLDELDMHLGQSASQQIECDTCGETSKIHRRKTCKLF